MEWDPRRTAYALAALAALAAAALGYFYATEYQEIGTLAAPLDDTYIHLRFAENIAHGRGFAFNPDHPIPGSTSPLWVVILVPFALGSKQALLTSALVLSSLAHLAAGILAFFLGRRAGLKTPFSLLAAGLVLANGRLLFAGLSGMETTLFAALTIAAALSHLRDTESGPLSWKTAALLGLATAARPEGYLFASGIFIHAVLRSLAKSRDFRPTAILRAAPLRSLTLYLALIAPYIIFALITIHHPLPSTFLAKQPEMAPLRAKYLYWSLVYFLMDNPAALVLFFLAAAASVHHALRRKLDFLASPQGLIAGWAIGYLALSAIFTPMPFHYCRYQLPLLPFCLLMAVYAAQQIIARIGLRPPGRLRLVPAPIITLGVILVLAVPQLLSTARWPAITARNAGNILRMHVTVGQLLARISQPGDRVATMDIGAIGFYSDREIVDLFGLVTPEVLPYFRHKGFTEERSRSLLRYLWKVRPQYLAVFPEAFPGMISDSRVFVPISEVRLPDKQVVMADWMVVCHCLWYKGAPPAGGE